jgi:ribosomal protein S18 acetylase RimI-like enzyme
MLEIRPIRAEETYAVRHPVLRTGKPIDSCAFAGDDLPTTFHLGCFDQAKLIGVASFLENGHSLHHFTNAGQLRGMAVLNEYQGKGVGKILLTFGEKRLLEKQIDLVWMNAREIAVPFYQCCGYVKIGNVFDIAGVGNHYVMYKKLN